MVRVRRIGEGATVKCGRHHRPLGPLQLTRLLVAKYWLRIICAPQPALGVDLGQVLPSRIHLVEKEEFRAKISADAEAKTVLGHVYITPRPDQPVDFARVVSHELAHAVSHYELEATVLSEEKRLKLRERRLGAMFRPQGVSGTHLYFNGLNEAATELFAVAVRKRISGWLPFDEVQTTELTSRVDYHPQVLLLTELIRRVASAEGTRPADVRRMVFRDYLNGTAEFLRHVRNSVDRRAVKLLASMGSEPEEARRISDALGFSECSARIARLHPAGSAKTE